ncbi:hypothetical protein AMJ80_12805 [bacterium SM23_31]|nr:MAG: hypothetical protein AMJ80_12805 [bacterium SM23_31]
MKEQGDIEGAISALRKATARNNRFAEAYYQLGLLYIEKGTFRSKTMAETVLLRARRIEQDSTKYLHALAVLYDSQTFYDIEKIIFKRIMKEDTTDMRALNYLSEYYKLKVLNYWNHYFEKDEYLIFNGKEITYENYTKYATKKNRFDRFISQDKYLKILEELSDRTLALEPEHRDAFYNKALILLERDDVEQLIELCKIIIEKNPFDPDANMFLGLGYSLQGKYEKSNEHYNLAFKTMNPEDRFIFENIDYLKPNVKVTLTGTDSSLINESDTFWNTRDPFYLTSYNERRLEHYSRVAEANLRFSMPRKGTMGWQTEQGTVWIKFGRPLRIERGLGQTELWFYENFRIIFGRTIFGNFDFYKPWNLRTNTNAISMEYPDYYRFRSQTEFFGLETDIVSFRGDNESTLVEIYYGLPVNKISWEPELDKVYGDVYHGAYIFDTDWGRITQEVDTSYLAFDSSQIDTSSSDILVTLQSFNLNAGEYFYAVEMLDPVSGNTGIFRSPVDVTYYGADSLMISDILVSRKADIIDREQPISRDNITFMASATHQFKESQPVVIYYEVYNLFVDDEELRNHYRMEYMIEPAPEEESIAKRLLKSLIWRGSKEEGISVSSEYRGVGGTDNQLLTIEHSITKPGEYLLTVRITDLISGMAAEKNTTIWIY